MVPCTKTKVENEVAFVSGSPYRGAHLQQMSDKRTISCDPVAFSGTPNSEEDKIEKRSWMERS